MALMAVHFRSEVLQLKCTMNALVPERPCPYPEGWPTLYLLHGLSDDHTAWQRYTSVERYAEGMDLAIIMPAVDRSFYADMVHGNRYWTFISQELQALCERLLPLSTRREDRFAAGLSMGGYGAFKLGLLMPQRFAAVASLSGAVDLVGMADDEAAQRDLTFFETIFGSLQALAGSDNDLVAAADRLIATGAPLPRFYQACGTEDFLYRSNVAFRDRFEKALSIAYEEGPGAHTWAFWDQYIQRVLAWLPLRG